MTKKDSISLFLFFIFPFLFLSSTLTSPETFFMRDITYLFHPWRSLASQMMQAGEMPLWNSYAMGGMPFLANCQSAILYPFTLLFFHFSFVIGLKFFHLLHYALAGLGFYLFARKMKLSVLASLIVGVLFSFNGYSLTRLEFLSALGSLIWLPWILLFLSNAINKTRWQQPAIGMGIVLSFSLFAGFPQIVILQLLAAALYFLLSRQFGIKKLPVLLLSGGIFLFLSAVQWLPTAELLPHSIRGGKGISSEEAGTYSLPIDSLFGLIFPYRILHHPDRFTGEKFFWIWSGWWGFTASFLLLLSFGTKRKRLLIIGWSLFLLGILWSMGNQFELFQFLVKNFFLFRLFRYPPVALYLTVTAVSLLSLCGLSFLKAKQKLLCILTISLMTELWCYARNIQPTVVPEYFSVTFPAIESAIMDSPGMVMLSPKVERKRRLAGMSSLEAKMRFRAYFFDLTNLPYRVQTVIPSGEPLALKSFEKLYYEKFSKTKSIEEASPLFNRWNITHFLTNEALKNKWNQIGEDRDLKVYRNPNAYGAVYAVKPEDSKNQFLSDILKPIQLKINNDKQTALFKTRDERIAIFNVPFYPGWKLFCFSCKNLEESRHSLQKVHDYFAATLLRVGEHYLFFVYQPLVWKVSVLLTIFTICILSFLFLKEIYATLQH